MTINFESKRIEEKYQTQNFINIIEKMLKNPNMAESIYSLYAG